MCIRDSGVIEITPIPTVEELNAHVWGEEFHACIIEQAEFEAIWESCFYGDVYKRQTKRVYYLNREIKGADRASFTVCTPLKIGRAHV